MLSTIQPVPRPGCPGIGAARRWVLAITVSAFGAALGWSASPALADAPATPRPAAPQAVFSLGPAQDGSTTTSAGGHFNYSVPAGAVIHGGVVAQNLTDAPVALRVYAADLVPLAGGGFSVAQLGQPAHDVAAWTTIPGTVSLPPLGQATVAFTVAVPAGVLPGDYGGAVAAEDTPTPSRGVAIQTRVALQVRVHVTGARPRLSATVGALTARRDGTGMRFTAVLANTGNESFSFDGRVALGRGAAVASFLPLRPARDYLFPGQKVTLTATWSHPPRYGHATAQALVTVQPPSGPAAGFADPPVDMNFFPWLLVILTLVALLLLLAVARAEWRRRDLWTAWLAETRRRREAVRRLKREWTAAHSAAPAAPPGPAPGSGG